ncbi:MAG: amidohydrolase family protein [Clostridiaceae bacterium]|jgi:imidazolonepropionase-like amidohydrolase|nr:amidohydrolase family protein [Clostridiaceae bacterium]
MDSTEVLLTNCMLLDGTGSDKTANATVAVKNEIIYDIGQADLQQKYNSQVVIDLKGMTLMPGIINSHIHINYADIEYLKKWLYSGVTTVRDMGVLDNTTVQTAIEKRRTMINSTDYPRVIMCGKFITAPGGYGGSSPLGVSTGDEVRQTVAELLSMGCDFIKTVLEDGYDPSTFGLPKLNPELLMAICCEAKIRGVRVAAHVSQTHNLEILVNAGINEAAHNVYDPIPDTLINKMVNNSVHMTTTMNLYKAFSDKYGAPFYQTCVDNLVRFVKAGGNIAVGTDFIEEELPWFESGMPLYEMQLLKEAGLDNIQIIMAATKNASEVLGMSHQIGTIEKGKFADMIAVDGDPLINLECLKDVVLVVKDGLVIKNVL